MDAFFVEVERLRRPELRGIPVAVGGDGPRGVVASASYEARRFGVRSAMPTGAARRACPQLVVVPADHRRYQEASEQVFAIFHRFTPLVEGVSLDEAFLDVSGLRLHYPHPVEVGEELRAVIRRELRLPASVGVAANKLLAKLASEEAKPDGLFHVPAARQLEFLHRLPVRRLWGVGEATQAALERLGVETVGDLAEVPLPALTRAVGEAVGRHLSELAQEIDGVNRKFDFPREIPPLKRGQQVLFGHIAGLEDEDSEEMYWRSVTPFSYMPDFSFKDAASTVESWADEEQRYKRAYSVGWSIMITIGRRG
jgi:DNA polymerase-4